MPIKFLIEYVISHMCYMLLIMCAICCYIISLMLLLPHLLARYLHYHCQLPALSSSEYGCSKPLSLSLFGEHDSTVITSGWTCGSLVYQICHTIV